MNMINMSVNMGNGFHANWNRSLRQGPSIDMRVGNSHAIDKLRAGGAGNVFGAQCSVTISREGRKLSAQMREQQPKSFAAAGAERLLLRQQRQDKMNQSEQSDTLSEISGLMQEIKRYNAAGEDKETITARQDALNRLFELKARQEEENDRRLKDAAGSVAGSSKDQEEIDRKNADLYLMLKSLEEKEEGEEERVEGSDAESDTADDGSDGMQFQESASMLGASAAKRELEVTGMIDGMFESGYGKLAQADAMMRDAQAELGLAAEALGRAELSEAEQNQLMAEHIERANNMMKSNYGEMMELRRKGHQEIQDAREVELKHIGVSPLDGVGKAKQAIMDAGAQAALQEVSQGALDKASEELERRVQEEIDRKNDAVSGTDQDDVQEKAEEIAEERETERLEEEKLEQENTELLQKKSILTN